MISFDGSKAIKWRQAYTLVRKRDFLKALLKSDKKMKKREKMDLEGELILIERFLKKNKKEIQKIL